jgi:mandelate racemase
MTQPHQTASGTVTESPLVLIDVATDQGVLGHGIVFTYTAAGLSPTADLIQKLAPLVEGAELWLPLRSNRSLSRAFACSGHKGSLAWRLLASIRSSGTR